MGALKLRLGCLGHMNSSWPKHPANFCKLVPNDLLDAINFHVLHSCSDVLEYRLTWCKRWLHRAAELDRGEKQVAMLRHLSTLKKRLKLTREILESLEYEDIETLTILDEGFPLAGEIDGASVFQKAYKPALSPWYFGEAEHVSAVHAQELRLT